MSGIVEYIIRLQDQMSEPFSKLSKSLGVGKSQFDKLSQSSDGLKNKLKPTADSLNTLQARLNKLKEYKSLIPITATQQLMKVNKEIDHLTSKIQKVENIKAGGLGNSLGNLFNQLPAYLTNPLVGIGATAALLINKGFKNSNQKLDFEILLGDGKGTELFNSLKKNIHPLLKDVGADAGLILAKSGMAADSIIPKLNALGNVSGGGNEKLLTLAETFSQVQRKGKLTEDVLAGMEQNGFRPLDIISRSTGESMSSLMKRLENGKISVSEIDKALESATAPGGQFAGVLEKIANSPGGKWTLLTMRVSGLLDKLSDKMVPLATWVIDKAVSGFHKFQDMMKFVSDKASQLYDWLGKLKYILAIIGGAIAGLVALMILQNTWTGVVTLATKGWAIAQGLLNTILAMNPLILVITLIMGAVAAIMIMWDKCEGFREVLFGLWEATKTVFGGIGDFVSEVLSGVWDLLKGVFNPANWFDDDYSFGDALDKIGKAAEKYGQKVQASFELGKAKGRASFAQSQAEGTTTDKLMSELGFDNKSTQSHFGGTQTQDAKKPDAKGLGAADSINAVSGGGVKNITVTVGKMIENLTVSINGGAKEAGKEIERIVEESMVRALASATAR